MRTVVLRVAALALLLLLALAGMLTIRTLRQLPDSIVYFVRLGETHSYLEGVGRHGRRRANGADLAHTLQMLIAGPNAEERARGLTSAIDPATRVLDFRLEGDLVTIDLSDDFARGGGTSLMQARLYQLFYTLTQPRAVNRVALYIEGQRVESFGSEGLLIDNPWRRPESGTLPSW